MLMPFWVRSRTSGIRRCWRFGVRVRVGGRLGCQVRCCWGFGVRAKVGVRLGFQGRVDGERTSTALSPVGVSITPCLRIRMLVLIPGRQTPRP